MPVEPPAGVAIFEDHVLIAETLALSLRRRGVNADVVTGAAIACVPANPSPFADQLVLLDLDLGEADGSDLIGPLTDAGARVVVLSGVDDPVRLGEALERGAEGVLRKSQPAELTIQTVLNCMAGQLAMAPIVREELLHDLETRRTSKSHELDPFEQLTASEADVLGSLMEGLAAADIAERRGVSVKTVHTQVGAVLSKLGVHSQLAAVALAGQSGWQPPVTV